MPVQTRVIHYYVCLGAAGGKEWKVFMYKKDLRRGPLIENPSKHHLHNAATVKEYLFPPVTMVHCLKPIVND